MTGLAADGRLRAAQARCGWTLAGGFVLSAVVYSYAFHSFQHPKEAVLFAAIIGAAAVWTWRCGLPRWGLWVLTPLWVLIVLGAALPWLTGALASPRAAVVEGLRLALLLAGGAFALEAARARRNRLCFLRAVAAAAVIVAILALGQYAGLLENLFPVFEGYTQAMYSVFGNQDHLGGFLAFALPVFLARVLPGGPVRRWGPPLLCAVLVAAVLGLSGSRTAWFAGAVGMTVTAAMLRPPWPRLVWSGAAFCAVAGAVALWAPHVTWERVAATFAAEDTGGRARLWFWDGAARMAWDHPVTGVGLGNYACRSPHYQGLALHAPGGTGHYHNELHTRHAHSDPLQLLAETGVVGVLCLAWFGWRVLASRRRWVLQRRAGWTAAACWGGLAAWVLFALFNFPMGSAPHVLGALLLLAALLGPCVPPVSAPRPPSGRNGAGWALALAIAAGAAAYVALALPASYWIRQGDDAQLAGETGRDAYARAAAQLWPPPLAYSRHGYALAAEGAYEAAIAALERALDGGLDTGAERLMLGALHLRLDDADAARPHLEAAVFRWPGSELAWRLRFQSAPAGERPALEPRAAQWLGPAAAAELADWVWGGAG